MQRYSSLGLAENPFPPTGTPTRHWILAGQSRIRAFRQLKAALEGASRGNILGVRISGGNGQGKSHLMRHAEYHLSKEPGMKSAVYIHCPSDPRVTPDLCHLTKLILDRLGREDFLEKLAWGLYGVSLAKSLQTGSFKGLKSKRRFPFRRKKHDKKYVQYLINNLNEDPLYIDEIIDEIDLEVLQKMVKDDIERHEMKDIYESSFISPEVTTHILNSELESDNWENLTNFFYNNTENALMTLKTIVNLMRITGYDLFTLLVDELERVEESKRDIFLQTLCLLLEYGPPNTCVVVACTPKIWGKILGIGEEPASDVGPALKRRFTELVPLENIEISDANEIVAAYLKEAEPALGIRKRSEISPFSEESVEMIWREVGALLGDLLISCYVSIELATDQNKKSVDLAISNEALERVIAATGLPLQTPSISPPPALSNQILDDFWGIRRNSERSFKVEKALREVLQKAVPQGGIMKVHSKKKRPLTSQGRREIDVLAYKGPKPIGFEVKAYEIKNEVAKKELEATFLIADENLVNHLVIVSTSTLSIEAANELQKRSEKVSLVFLDEPKLTLLLYVSNVMGIQRGASLQPDEAIEALKQIGVMEIIDNC